VVLSILLVVEVVVMEINQVHLLVVMVVLVEVELGVDLVQIGNRRQQYKTLVAVVVADLILVAVMVQEAVVVPVLSSSLILHKYSKNIQWA
jgi:hypothetical protein